DFELVTPSLSILAEPTVALVDGNLTTEPKRKAAQAYLDFLYAPAAQAAAAKNFYRPSAPQHASPADLAVFPQVKLVTIDKVCGSCSAYTTKYLADCCEFRRIMAEAPR